MSRIGISVYTLCRDAVPFSPVFTNCDVVSSVLDVFGVDIVDKSAFADVKLLLVSDAITTKTTMAASTPARIAFIADLYCCAGAPAAAARGFIVVPS